MDAPTIESLREILDYLYADEKRSWQEAGEPEGGHIFNDIKRVVAWLDSE